jgi:hypothetical protein
MCTPADDNILIVGTALGAINLYDLSNFENSGLGLYRENELDYNGLLKLVNPNKNEGEDEMDGETNHNEKLKALKNRY